MTMPSGSKLSDAADTASFIMNQQLSLYRLLKIDKFESDTAITAAFAYGVWDAITQLMDMTDTEFVASIPLFASCWMKMGAACDKDFVSSKSIYDFGTGGHYATAVLCGGSALHAFLYEKLDSSLAKCLSDAEILIKRPI